MSTLPLFGDPPGDGLPPDGSGKRKTSGQGRGNDDDKREHVFRVSQLNRAVRGVLEQRWGSVRALYHRQRLRLARLIGQLSALSPLASLARGYAIVLHEPSGRALLRASDAQPGDSLQVRLHDGTLRARVEAP